jgi:NitT/TauT family transport system permease protein
MIAMGAAVAARVTRWRWDRVVNVHNVRGAVGIAGFFGAWQLAVWLHLPIVGKIPTPAAVLASFLQAIQEPGYFAHWAVSLKRVAAGFVLAQLLGIPAGLLMAMSRRVFYLTFPIFETLRPIPPLAWVPVAIMFWPTTEASVVFILFLGAFYTTVINTIGGVRSIDERYIQAAQSLGASPRLIFRKIVLAGAMPSVVTGMSVGLGITWMVSVAAEMMAGRSGLGFMTWESYVGGNFPRIIVGMVSIGLAGYLSSSIVRWLGDLLMPWRRLF